MRDYLMTLPLARVRMAEEDPGSSISNLSYARRNHRRSGLTRIEQRQVLGSAGAAWDTDAIETALTMMFSDAHQDDKGRLRQVEGGRDPRPYRPASSASTSASTSSGHSRSSLGRSSS